jgi:DNA-binding MarR family transcriptional regulator
VTDPVHSSVFLELHALDALATALLRRTAPTLISSDYAAMSAIIALETATPSSVAGVLGVPLTTASDRLNRLVARGLARRVPHPRDGRSAIFELTDKGHAHAREIAIPFSRLVDRVRERLELPEGQIFEALTALDRALRAELRELDPEHSPPP